ncbi:MAG TPA: DUF6580 family putative transport protein [Chthoniobacterales bacterium]|nr:DUF6580 family putative transport protein [Chthoniobacterales bacterium]
MNTRFLVLSGFVLAAAMSRLLPHPPNVTPIAAMALFAGAYFSSRKLAFLLPLVAMLVSDVVLAATVYGAAALRSQPMVYACILATAGIGMLLRRSKSPMNVACATLASSVLFYVATNFAVWAFGSLYPKTWAGLLTCYTAAIPFFRNSLAGDACFAVLLFGGFALLETFVRSIREQPEPLVAGRA